MKFIAWFTGEMLGKFESVEDAQACIYGHPAYIKSKFTKRGKPTSTNPNQKEYFAIYDNQGYGWNVK